MTHNDQKINMNELAMILQAQSNDFNDFRGMKNSQDSSFHDFQADHVIMNPGRPNENMFRESIDSIPEEMSLSHIYKMHLQNNNNESDIDYADDGEKQFNAPSTQVKMKIKPKPQPQAPIDPKLKVLGSEISKKVNEVRKHSQDIQPTMIGNENVVYDETLKQRNACAHCLMKRRTVIVPKGKEGTVEQLYCDKHTIQPRKGLNRSKSPTRENLKPADQKLEEEVRNIQRTLKKEDAGGPGELEELRKLLEMTEKDLYDEKEKMNKMGFENRALNDALDRVEFDKDNYQRQLARAGQAYMESVSIIETLLERIKRHLIQDLSLYEKLETVQQGRDLGEVKNFVPKMKVECEEILRQIRDRIWENFSVREAQDFLAKLDEAKGLRREVIKLEIEKQANDEVNQKLENYIKELEEQVNDLLNNSKTANKNNVMKVLDLTKSVKENGMNQAKLKQGMHEAQVDAENLKIDLQAEKEEKDRKMHELNRKIREQDDELKRIQQELYALQLEGPKQSKIEVGDDVQEAIKQLSLIILSKEGNQISDQTRKLLKDVFPDTFAKNITQWEQRVRELEEQNQRLLENYNDELQKGRFYATIAFEYCSKIFELLRILDENPGMQLPPDMRRFKDHLLEERQGLEQVYQELEEAMEDYDERLSQLGRESLTLDTNKLGKRSSYFPSRAGIYGAAGSKFRESMGDGEDPQAKKMKRIEDQNEQMKMKLESAAAEIASLSQQLNHLRQKEDSMMRTLSRYESNGKGKHISPRDYKSMSKTRLGGKSSESSFSMMGDNMVIVDTNWTKARVAESADLLMMLQVQALAIEDRIKKEKEDRLDLMVKQGTNGLRKDDTLLTNDFSKDKFSFYDQF